MSRRIVTAREQHEMLSPWRTASGFDPMAVTTKLKGEFHDWFDSLPEHRLDELKNIEMHPFMDHHENNPVSHWPTVERFLKDKYPAAHRGFMTGHEDASMWLDNPNNEYEDPMLEGDDEFGSLPPPEPYSSADHQKLGYDPQEVAAGMVLLHNRAHSGRQDSYLETDKKRLVDIYNKRQQMQRNYERQANLWRMAGFDPREVTDRLGGEFRDWADQNRHRLHPTDSYPPQRDWRNIEMFLKDNYPAAHKGFSKGQEQAGEMLDYPAKGRRYQTGPKTLEALGYDPREIAAGALYLHNSSHPFRMEWSNDLDRLTRIYDNRQRMQRNYEQRTGATYWHLTDNPDFRPDPTFRPENNGTLGGNFNPGLFVSQHPNHWMQSYGYYRPYVSEIDVPDEVGRDFHNSPERFITPDQYDKITVKRTIPIDAYTREQYGESGPVESSLGEDFETGEKFTDYQPMSRDLYKKTPGYKYPGTAMDQPEQWRNTYEQKVRDYQQRTPGIIAGRY